MIGDRIMGWIRDALSDGGADTAALRDSLPGFHAVEGRGLSPRTIAGPEVEHRLKSMIAADGALVGGSLHLVGLADLKLRLGDRWHKASERVHSVAQKAILRHLGPRDVFFQFDDTLYVLVFADMAPEQARLMAAAIVEEIYRTLLGEADLATLTVKSAVTRLDGSTVLETRSIADLLADALKVANPDISVPPAPAKWQLHPPPVDIALRYRPVWDVRRQVLSTYVCIPTARNAGASTVTGYEVLGGRTDPEAFLGLDVRVLAEAVETLDELFRNKFRFILVIPVHAETLAHTTRRRLYTGHLQEIPPHVRGLTQLSVFGLPSGTPYSRMAELISVLRPFVRGVFVHAGMDWPDFRVLAEAGVRVVSVDWPRGRSLKQVGETLAHFKAETARLHLRSFIDGVPNTIAARLVRVAGVDFFAGPVLQKDLEVPQHMLRFTWADIAGADEAKDTSHVVAADQATD